MPNSGTVRKSNRMKNPSAKMNEFFKVNLNQNDNNNSNEIFIHFTANSNSNQKNFYKNSARNNNLSFIDSDNNQALRIYHQNICDLGTKTNDLLASLYPYLPHILCLTEHHLRQFQIQHITMDDYNLGVEFSR
jgi:maltoporin